MIQSDRYLPSLSIFAISLSVCGLGCNSESESDYQKFSEIKEVDGSSTVSKTGTTGADITTVEPLRAPRPEFMAVSAKTTNGTNEEGELIPLKAVKPVFGESAKELKDNIENAAAETQEAREIKLLVKAPSFRKEEGAYRVSYDDIDLLKTLNMEPVPPDAVSYFPEWLSNLDGKRIRIRGFMYPTFRQTGIDIFVLARDNQICCFGRNPKIYDLITVEMKQGVTTDYILNRPFDVVGTFHIRPDVEDGELFNLYEITDAVVVDK
jgi:hypothetical protein